MSRRPMIQGRLVFVTVFVVAACGLGYELVAGALASYLLGDSITQFSLAIGLYLFALGIGAWLSRFIEKDLVDRFVDVELVVAIIGGASAAILFLAFGHGHFFRPALNVVILLVGTFVGLEIPLLMRILKGEIVFRDLVSKVLTFDYVGALVVSILFPLFFVPDLGLVRTAFVLGLANAAVALWSTWIFGARLVRPGPARIRCALVIALLAAGAWYSDRITAYAEQGIYSDPVIWAHATPYQRIVVTQNAAGFQLFLNGALQFSSADEYRYHEALVHPAFAVVPEPRRVLVLGGGDGLAVREILRHPEVEHVTLVDIDPEMTALARTLPPLADLNRHALDDPRVTVVNDDALRWLEHPPGLFDLMIVDFPDPSSFSVGKLYTTRFYDLAQKALSAEGAITVQATSPLFARRAYWCVVRTMEASGLTTRPYHAFVPSFGEWGFVLASRRQLEVPAKAMSGLRSLDGTTMAGLFALPPDLGPVPVEANRLDNQILVHYYEDEWRRWN